MAYDRTIVVFSPDGRLLQVEYAREMVKNGSTSLGVRTKDGVLLASMRSSPPLAVTESYRKTYEIDNHIGLVFSGSTADTRELVEMGRVRSQINMITYGEPISVSSLTTYICDRKHLVTQYAGVRPYGVGLLIGGVNDDGIRLFETEPSGTMIEWKAQAIGRGAVKARSVLQKGYKEGMDKEKALHLILSALKSAEKDATPETTEVLYVNKGSTTKLPTAEIKKSF